MADSITAGSRDSCIMRSLLSKQECLVSSRRFSSPQKGSRLQDNLPSQGKQSVGSLRTIKQGCAVIPQNQARSFLGMVRAFSIDEHLLAQPAFAKTVYSHISPQRPVAERRNRVTEYKLWVSADEKCSVQRLRRSRPANPLAPLHSPHRREKQAPAPHTPGSHSSTHGHARRTPTLRWRLPPRGCGLGIWLGSQPALPPLLLAHHRCWYGPRGGGLVWRLTAWGTR